MTVNNHNQIALFITYTKTRQVLCCLNCIENTRQLVYFNFINQLCDNFYEVKKIVLKSCLQNKCIFDFAVVISGSPWR